MQVSTAEFKKGLRIVFDDQPYQIVEFQHVKPGKGGACWPTRCSTGGRGRLCATTFRWGEKFEGVDCEEKHMRFLSGDARSHFRDREPYEKASWSAEGGGDARKSQKENPGVEVLY